MKRLVSVPNLCTREKREASVSWSGYLWGDPWINPNRCQTGNDDRCLQHRLHMQVGNNLRMYEKGQSGDSILRSYTDLRDVGISDSGCICHSPQYSISQFISLIPEPQALAVVPFTGRNGRCTCFLVFPY